MSAITSHMKQLSRTVATLLNELSSLATNVKDETNSNHAQNHNQTNPTNVPPPGLMDEVNGAVSQLTLRNDVGRHRSRGHEQLPSATSTPEMSLNFGSHCTSPVPKSYTAGCQWNMQMETQGLEDVAAHQQQGAAARNLGLFSPDYQQVPNNTSGKATNPFSSHSNAECPFSEMEGAKSKSGPAIDNNRPQKVVSAPPTASINSVDPFSVGGFASPLTFSSLPQSQQQQQFKSPLSEASQTHFTHQHGQLPRMTQAPLNGNGRFPVMLPNSYAQPVSSNNSNINSSVDRTGYSHLGSVNHSQRSLAEKQICTTIEVLQAVCIRQNGELHRQQELIRQMHHQLYQLQKSNQELTCQVKEMESLDSRSNCGDFYWRITGYADLLKRSSGGETIILHSNPFLSSPWGYKLCIRANITSGQDPFLSLFIHFMQGSNDNLLRWPFKGQIVLTVIDQKDSYTMREHISETLDSKPHLEAFKQPTTARNHKGFGFTEFVTLSILQQRSSFIRNNTLIIRAQVLPQY